CTAVNAGGLNATNSKSKAVTAAFLQGEKITLTYSGLWDWLYLETPEWAGARYDNGGMGGTGTLPVVLDADKTIVRWRASQASITVTATCTP
ncbi:hypothetical protein, partial [Klebsiella aerogenes]|uniref:hypothetical protein n=1 Tax=Klebsiella aerogenes TaxID=548 RepID=UPI0013D2FFA2